jgi:hypothetical protein
VEKAPECQAEEEASEERADIMSTVTTYQSFTSKHEPAPVIARLVRNAEDTGYVRETFSTSSPASPPPAKPPARKSSLIKIRRGTSRPLGEWGRR